MGLGPSSTAWAPSTEPMPCRLTVIRPALRRLLEFRSRFFEPLLLLGSVGDVDLDRVRHESGQTSSLRPRSWTAPAGRTGARGRRRIGGWKSFEARAPGPRAPRSASRPSDSSQPATRRCPDRVLAGFSERSHRGTRHLAVPRAFDESRHRRGIGVWLIVGTMDDDRRTAMVCGSRRLDQPQLQGTH